MKATLLILALLVSRQAIAGTSEFKYEYQQALEARRCAHDGGYCKLAQELKELSALEYNTSTQLSDAEDAPGIACENSDVRQAERASFDSIANRFPIKTPCSEISDYKVAVEQSQAVLPYLKLKLKYVRDRIEEIKVETAERAAQIDD